VLRAAGLRRPRRADYSPANALEIRYRNFRGEEKTFTADADSLQRKRNHVIAAVKPTGEKIALSCERIQNLSEVEEALPKAAEPDARSSPTARERQVLSFHLRYKSTSPLYEKIRAKYPDWVPPDLRNS
jgi:hypothetical protein